MTVIVMSFMAAPLGARLSRNGNSVVGLAAGLRCGRAPCGCRSAPRGPVQDGRFIEFELCCCDVEGEWASFRGLDTLAVAVAGYVGAAAAAAGLVIG
ncbi:MAG: hypothetical protein ACYC90_11020 [Candidatus Nanopelagicales bacterium]